METESGRAREQIRTVLYRYCRGVDRNDWGLLRACFHPGAVDEHGRYNGEIDGFVAWLQAKLRCVHEFIRTDPVCEASVPGPAYRRGTRNCEDASYVQALEGTP